MVLTSHDRLGDTGRKTGFWLEEFAAPYYVFKEAGAEIVAPSHAEVVHKAFRGAEILSTLRLESGRKVLALVPSHHNHAIGERIGIRLDVDHVVAFAPEEPKPR